MVSSRHFNSQAFKLIVSDPRTVAYVHVEMPLNSSNLPGGWAHSSRLNLLKTGRMSRRTTIPKRERDGNFITADSEESAPRPADL